ncbi:uncharacterized mitochondrial protein AtMg00310-like [Hevea brasiliensis]|uniref:uncharacterized mitochondrial protein AtMg00310-like n=1 Tax=Hevea brasiliensis TaxID=3981 RepID=UPI0025D014FC|nr:uncharacterized mitochondrial protein AtMg00310-like [Hevea brasiliensis]
MGVFRLPHDLCAFNEHMLNSFSWGCSGSQASGIRWMAWSRLCVCKADSGIGFQRLSDFNTVLLRKQAWRLLTQPSYLVARVFAARYYPRNVFLDVQLGSNPSFVCCSLWSNQQLLHNGCRWRIGSRSKVRVWDDPWLPKNECLYVQSDRIAVLGDFRVCHLMYANGPSRNESLVHGLFGPKCEEATS